tara:strand:- start:39 stop:2831 length:2793 start_codon:yes stop_codon:yes gene_type:complete
MQDVSKEKALIELYKRGVLQKESPEKARALEELSRRGELSDSLYSVERGEEAFAKGLYSAGASLLGLPVDIAAAATRAVGIPTADKPIMGSAFLREKLKQAGQLSDVVPFIPERGYAYESISEVAPSARPFAVAGETVGAATTGGAGIAAAASRQVPTAIRLARDLERPVGVLRGAGREIIETARQKPIGTFATELGLGGAAGIGAGIAEVAAPSSPSARIVGEVAATFTPTLVVSRFAPQIINKMRMVAEDRLPKGRQREAARQLQEGLLDEGIDPVKYADNVLSQQMDIESLTAAQVGDSQYLSALENTLIKDNANVGARYKKQAEKTIASFNKQYKDLLQTGDPDKIIVAAQARRDYLEGLLDNRIDRANEKARQALRPIESLGARDAEDASIRARNIVEDALGDARATENQLWRSIDENISIEPNSTANAIAKARSELLEEESLSSPIQQFSSRVFRSVQDSPDQNTDELISRVFGSPAPQATGNGSIVTSGDMLRIRSVALEKARELRAAAKFNDARIVSDIAEAALNDLQVVQGIEANIARDFSRRLNEKITTTFAGDILRTKRTGRDAVRAEEVLGKAMTGRAGAAQMRELREAAEPLSYGPYTEEAISRQPDMLEAQRDFILAMTNQVRNPVTDEIDANRLARFLRNNQVIIDEIGLSDQLSDIESAVRFSQKAIDTKKRASAFFDKRKVAARFLKTEDPNKVVARALQSDTPSKDFSDMIKLAKTDKSGEALEGLRSSIFESVLNSSTSRKTGGISSDQLDSFLSRKIPSTNRSMEKELLSSGAITQSQLNSLKKIMSQAKRFEGAISEASTIDNLLENESAMFDLFVRIIGANLGSMSAVGQATGAPLVMAGAGVRTAQKLMLKLPAARVKDVMIQAMFDPQFMAELLKKRVTVKLRQKSNQRIEAYLLRNAIIEEDEQE